MTGPCPGGAYCYPVFSGGYKTVPGQIIAGQPQAPKTVGVGNITGFVCSNTPQGKPGEKFWQGACPGTWGPQGPFYPTKGSAPVPQHGECVPKNPPPPPPGYKMIWRKAKIAGDDGKFTKFICKPIYLPASAPGVSDPDCKCSPTTPTTGGPPNPPIVPKSPTTGPQDGCGPNMASGGTEARKLWGHDAGEHFEGGAVAGQLIALPVHDGTSATSQPDWTHRPRVIRNKHGIYQVWDGTADGNIWLAPGELYDHHLYGDGTLAGSKWPSRVSYNGFMIHSGARTDPTHGDDSCGVFGIGKALKNSRYPASGYSLELDTTDSKTEPDAVHNIHTAAGADSTVGEHKFKQGLVLPKTSGVGVKVDTAAPTFGWRDLLGDINIRGTGGADPSYPQYRNTIRAFLFEVNDEVYLNFHIPHDYVPGSDMHLHFHWSQGELQANGSAAGTPTGGSVTWGAEFSYSKGHGQDEFISSLTTTVQQTLDDLTPYHHYVTETLLSEAGSVVLLDSDEIEVDGVILMRVYLSANAITVDSGQVPDPALHFVDVHYQSTGMATKDKAPNFYT